MDNRYFRLFPHCEWVRGSCRSAIYDFARGQLFHLDEQQGLILDHCEKNVAVTDIPTLPSKQVEQILAGLSQLGVGRFYNSPVYIDPFKPQSSLELPGLLETPPIIQLAYLQIATDCNLDCAFCGQADHLAWLGCNSCLRWPGVRSGQKMLPAQIDTVIDQLMVLEVMNVHLSGCNPLLHLDLVKRVVERIRQQQRFPVGIVLHTNGIGLTPDFLDYAVENKIGFNFSLFATSADGYQPLSQNSAAFALVNTAMQQCQERQIPFITCVVLPPQAQETWLARKVHASQTGSQRVLFTEFISTLQPEPVTSVPVNEPRERTFNRDYFFFRKRSNVCLFGTLAIDAQLRLRPCPMITDCLGDLTQETIHDILQNKETMPYWNYTKRQVKVCQDCEFRYLCADCSMVEQETENQPELLKAICGYNPYTGCWPSQEHLSAEPAYVLEG